MSKLIYTGGSAFPKAGVNTSDGMTLRDYFAAKALEGMAALPELDGTREDVANVAYLFADAMLAERSKE